MPAVKYSCYLQADTVQPHAPIREGRPLHQLNEPSDLHANKGGGSIHHCRKGLGDAHNTWLVLGKL